MSSASIDQLFFVCYCGVGWDARVCRAYTQLRYHPMIPKRCSGDGSINECIYAMLALKNTVRRVCPAYLCSCDTREAGWMAGNTPSGALRRDREQRAIVRRWGSADGRLIYGRWPVRGDADPTTVALLLSLSDVALLSGLASLLFAAEPTGEGPPSVAPERLCPASGWG